MVTLTNHLVALWDTPGFVRLRQWMDRIVFDSIHPRDADHSDAMSRGSLRDPNVAMLASLMQANTLDSNCHRPPSSVSLPPRPPTPVPFLSHTPSHPISTSNERPVGAISSASQLCSQEPSIPSSSPGVPLTPGLTSADVRTTARTRLTPISAACDDQINEAREPNAAEAAPAIFPIPHVRAPVPDGNDLPFTPPAVAGTSSPKDAPPKRAKGRPTKKAAARGTAAAGAAVEGLSGAPAQVRRSARNTTQ